MALNLKKAHHHVYSNFFLYIKVGPTVTLVSCGQAANGTRGEGIFFTVQNQLFQVFPPAGNLYADSHLELLEYNETP